MSDQPSDQPSERISDQPSAQAGQRPGDATNAAGIRRVEEASGLAWAELVAVFAAAGGAAADHGALAAAIEPVLTGRVDNPGWWAQGATVEYERAIGRRVAGQSSAGDFQVAASRTLSGAAGDLRDRAGEALLTVGTVAGMPVGEDARTSETPKRHYWRSGLGGAAKLEVAVETAAARKTDAAAADRAASADGPASAGGAASEAGADGAAPLRRVRVTLTATGLADQDQRDAARTDLRAVLAELG